MYLSGSTSQQPLIAAPYWADAEYAADDVPLHEFADVMSAVKSRFFTMDLARAKDGTWTIIELGDAQVAGLLDTIPPRALFGRLADRLG